jgi:putative transposase
MAIKKEILDELLKDKDPKAIFSSEGLMGELKKALAERVLNAEMDHHIADSTQDGVSETDKANNHRNGYSKKTVLTENEAIELSIPRDRRGTFEPQLIAKYQRRFPGFDEKIISMYARGLSVREIQGHLREIYGIEASPQLISTVTDAVLEEVGRWQSRPLDPLYALVFFDALRVKMRDEGTVRNKAVYLAIGVSPEGRKEVLGIWIEQTEGAKFWLRVMTEIKNRGVNDILIAIIDGLKGFPEAINSVFPETQIQTCIVHLIRNSLDYCSWKDRKPLAQELKKIYRAADAQAAGAALQEFEDTPLGRKFAAVPAIWRRHWAHIIPFFAYPQEVRKMIYTTNAIESLNAKLRRSVRIRGHFPNDESAMKLIWLQLREITQKWKMAPREWSAAKAQFAVVFGDRFEVNRPHNDGLQLFM